MPPRLGTTFVAQGVRKNSPPRWGAIFLLKVSEKTAPDVGDHFLLLNVSEKTGPEGKNCTLDLPVVLLILLYFLF